MAADSRTPNGGRCARSHTCCCEEEGQARSLQLPGDGPAYVPLEGPVKAIVMDAVGEGGEGQDAGARQHHLVDAGGQEDRRHGGRECATDEQLGEQPSLPHRRPIGGLSGPV